MNLRVRLRMWWYKLKPSDFQQLGKELMIAWLDHNCESWLIIERKEIEG